MEAVAPQVPSRTALLPVFVVASLALHAAAIALVSGAGGDNLQPRPASPPVELVMVEVEPPKPEAIPSVPPVIPTPRRPAKVAAARPRAKESVPPPPNENASDAPKEAPLSIGLTMSSTTTGGSFAAPVGNTLYGKNPANAPPPGQSAPYAAPDRWVPAYQLDSQPAVLSEVKIPYPPAAQREGIEGTVVASIVIDEDGKVVSAKVLSGPGHGLNEAAHEAFSRFRFKPALKGGRPVATEIKYKYTFVLN